MAATLRWAEGTTIVEMPFWRPEMRYQLLKTVVVVVYLSSSIQMKSKNSQSKPPCNYRPEPYCNAAGVSCACHQAHHKLSLSDNSSSRLEILHLLAATQRPRRDGRQSRASARRRRDRLSGLAHHPNLRFHRHPVAVAQDLLLLAHANKLVYPTWRICK